LAIIHERVPRNQPALPDLSFDLLPDADWALAVAEYIIVFQVLGVFVLIFLHRYRFVFRKFILFSIQNLNFIFQIKRRTLFYEQKSISFIKYPKVYVTNKWCDQYLRKQTLNCF